MKCPKCGINLLEHVDVCPFCKTPIPKESIGVGEDVQEAVSSNSNTDGYSETGSVGDSYDFDLQYTLTFRDSGEIKQAIADMDAGAQEIPRKKTEGTRRSSDGSRYTLEEMQAAALRSQQRRERRNASRVSGETEEPRKKKHITHAEKKKRVAMRAAKEKQASRATTEDKPAPKSHRGLFIGMGVLAFVIVLIVGVVNICAYFAHKDPEYPTMYVKGNELYSYYDGKEVLLSSNFITVEDESGQTNSGSSGSRVTDPKTDVKKTITEKDLVKVSENGAVTYFFENVNMGTRVGNLVYYANGKRKSRRVLAQNVYYDIEVGKDGASVLYVKNADNDGAHGELCYWSPSRKEEVVVDQDITAGNFKFSQDCMSMTYIKNFNPIVHTGDLHYLSFAEGAERKSKRLDEKVAFVFGTTVKSKTYFYAKNYDTTTGTYDLYVQSDAEGPKAIAEKGFLPPVISQKNESAFVYSNYHNNFQTLSCVDFATGSNTKLADEITEIVKIRIDDGAVIYSKAYENEKADYYLVNAKSPKPQTVATAINTTSVKNSAIVSFDASDDFSRIAYIGGFDTSTMRGALYTLSVINDYAGSEIRISDDAYSCDVSADGSVVRFATSYNTENNTVSLVSYANSNTLALADGVGIGAFTFDKLGDYAVYAKNIDSQNAAAKIESVNRKARIKEIDNDVSAYGLKRDGVVLLLKKTDEGGSQKTTLCKTSLKGGKIKPVAEGIDRVLLY